MRRLFAALDVDFQQWKALTAVLLKLDFRGSAMRSASGVSGATATLIFQFLFHTLIGGAMAAVVIFARQLFLAGTVTIGMTMFIIGTAVLLDHNSAIASPGDYAILGFRPITSRTYFAIRLTNVLVYTTVLTTAAVWLPIVALFVRHGARVGGAGIVAFYACSISTALAVLMGYAWMLRIVGADWIRGALSIVQLAMSFVVYGGYMVMTHFVTRSFIGSLVLPRGTWLAFFPPAWFASYLELAAGNRGATEIAPAIVSIVALAAMGSALRGRLSLDYSERLGAMLSAAATRRAATQRSPAPRSWDLFKAGEARCVALLVRSQFRNDQRFKMGVLAVLPMTLLYLVMGIRSGSVHDPFVPAPRGAGFSLVTMAVMMFPPMLKFELARSEAFRASWIFFACPIDRMKIVRASKNVLVAYFLIPYLAFVAAITTYFAGHALHVAVHITLLGLISHLVLQIVMFLDPALPFSRPPADKGRRSTSFIGLVGGIVIVVGIVGSFSPALYGSVAATLTALALLLLASAALDRLTRARVERQTGSLEFEG
ncbi:MAG: hypothetical protein ABJC89_11185 [Acidobacteriota bacterium]